MQEKTQNNLKALYSLQKLNFASYFSLDILVYITCLRYILDEYSFNIESPNEKNVKIFNELFNELDNETKQDYFVMSKIKKIFKIDNEKNEKKIEQRKNLSKKKFYLDTFKKDNKCLIKSEHKMEYKQIKSKKHHDIDKKNINHIKIIKEKNN